MHSTQRHSVYTLLILIATVLASVTVLLVGWYGALVLALVPVGLVVYEFRARSLKYGFAFLTSNLVGILGSVFLCYRLADVDSDVGIFVATAIGCFLGAMNNSVFRVKDAEANGN